jgi:hypothetical protein
VARQYRDVDRDPPSTEEAMAQKFKSKRLPTRSRDWLEAECLRLARGIPGGNKIQCIMIRRLRPKGAGTNWKVADIVPQPSLLTSNNLRAALARLTEKYALED